MLFFHFLQHGNAATSSETSVGGGGGSSGSGAPTGSTRGAPPQGNKFRHGLLQLMIHTIDPLHDGKTTLICQFYLLIINALLI